MAVRLILLLIFGVSFLAFAAYLTGTGPELQTSKTVQCEEFRLRKPADAAVSLSIETTKPVYDHTKTAKEIGELQGGPLSRSADWDVRGLTDVKAYTTVNAFLKTKRLNDGTYCAAATGVTARVILKRITVYVDRQYAEGSCQRNAIIAHENAHVEIFRKGLEPYRVDIERDLSAAVYETDAVHGADIQTVKSAIAEDLNSKFAAISKRYSELRDQKHEEIDTPASYNEFTSTCPVW